MPNFITQYFTHQRLPAPVLRFPRVLYLYFVIHFLTVPRIKFARRAIKQTLRSMPALRRVCDAGCGLGDFLFTVPKIRRAGEITGIDLSQSNIEACRRLAEITKNHRMEFIHADLENVEIQNEQDLIICIAVLMYIKNDAAVLSKFYNALSATGQLLLYVPVNYRRHLPLYLRLSRRSNFDYDTIVGRAHSYTDSTIEQKLNDAGFQIESRRASFGTAAASMFEISTIFEWMFRIFHPVASLALIPFYLIFLPVYHLILWADYFSKRTTGNGVMITARKLT